MQHCLSLHTDRYGPSSAVQCSAVASGAPILSPSISKQVTRFELDSSAKKGLRMGEEGNGKNMKCDDNSAMHNGGKYFLKRHSYKVKIFLRRPSNHFHLI